MHEIMHNFEKEESHGIKKRTSVLGRIFAFFRWICVMVGTNAIQKMNPHIKD